MIKKVVNRYFSIAIQLIDKLITAMRYFVKPIRRKNYKTWWYFSWAKTPKRNTDARRGENNYSWDEIL